MADVSRREHMLREVLGGMALMAVVGAGTYFAGVWGWMGQQIESLGEPVTVSRWWHWMLLANLFLTLGLIALNVIAGLRQGPPPEYTAYCEDTFFGLVWRWNWTPTGRIGEPWCWCPRCDRQAVYHTQYDLNQEPTTILHCQACGTLNRQHGRVDEYVEQVRREIDLKVRNGSWKAVVEAKEHKQLRT